MASDYSDVREILDEALETKGGTVTCPTPGAAVHWRQRAYTLRAMEQRRSAVTFHGTPMAGKTKYDAMVLRIERGSNVVDIGFNRTEVHFEPKEPRRLDALGLPISNRGDEDLNRD